ncbi:hypothetical protein D3C87_1835960 [compost metagenome]
MGRRLRASTMASMAPKPTFLMAPRPKRIPSSVGVKSEPLELTSGGRTMMPMRRQSLMQSRILSWAPRRLLIRAAMYSEG